MNIELKSFLRFPSVILQFHSVGPEGGRPLFSGGGGSGAISPGGIFLRIWGPCRVGGRWISAWEGPRPSSLVFTSALWLPLAPWSVCALALACVHACLGLSLGVTLTPRSWPPDPTWKPHCPFCVGQTLTVLGPWGASCREHGVSWPGVSAP